MQSYASILYLKLPANFRIILRGKDVEHHSLLHDMMMTEEKVYKPKSTPEECTPDQNVINLPSLTFFTVYSYSLKKQFKIKIS